jgi:steroid delta-isomerase-like uncharacterized protein
MENDGAAFVRRWFEEVWNKKRPEAVDEMLAEDGVGYGLPGGEIRGPAVFKEYQKALVSAYPDLNVVVEDTIVEGEKVAARCRVTGVHQGEGLGISATNQPVEFTGMVMMTVRDGKIVEAWNEFNFMEMYQQVGALTLNLQ